jgi:MFS family permease
LRERPGAGSIRAVTETAPPTAAERARGFRYVVRTVVRDRDLRLVELAFFGFNMSEYATWIAILVYAYSRGGAAEAGFVSVLQLVPAAVVAPFGAYAGDRFRRDRVLFVDYLVQAGALGAAGAALLLDLPVVVVYACAVVAAASLTFSRPAHNSLLPALTDSPEHLTAANVVTGVAEGSGVMLGPLIGGVLIAWQGPGTVFVVFAAVMLVGAMLVRRLHADLSVIDSVGERMTPAHVLRETAGGFGALWRAPKARLVVLVLSLGVVVLGALDVLFVASAIDLLHMGESGPSWLGAAFGIGGIIGATATVTLVGRRRLTPPLMSGALVMGVPVAGLAAVPSVAAAPVLFAASGAGWSLADVAGRTLLQRVAPDDVLARIFGIYEGVAMIALAVGSAAAAVLVESFGIRVTLIVAGGFVPLVVLVTGPRLLAIDRDAAAPDPHLLELLRRTPIFAPMPAPAIERLVANLIRVDLRPGHVVIREGERGDRFYLIDRGEVEVTAGGRPLGHRGAGDYVGEIALLRDVRRTATVTAVTQTTLYALDRDVFLLAVTGHPGSRDVAEERIERDLSELRRRRG